MSVRVRALRVLSLAHVAATLAIGCGDEPEAMGPDWDNYGDDDGYGDDDDDEYDDGGESGDAHGDDVDAEFPEFMSLGVPDGLQWTFEWTHEMTGTSPEYDSGSFTIVLSQPRDVEGIEMYAATYHHSGDAIPFVFDEHAFIGVDSGRIYVMASASGVPTPIFDAVDGIVYGDGFFGGMVPEGPAELSPTTLSGPYASGSGLVAKDWIDDGGCETISGQTFCDDQSHSFALEELYSPSLGPVGYRRSGTSVFSGAYPAVYHSETRVDLVSSKPAPNPPSSDGDDGGVDPNSCLFANDGECDEPEGTGYCYEGTDATDCAGVPWSAYGECPCEDDAECVSLGEGVGSFCAPRCGADDSCPSSSGTSAEAWCVLGPDPAAPPTHCALLCESDAQCPAGASCAAVGSNYGVCVF